MPILGSRGRHGTGRGVLIRDRGDLASVVFLAVVVMGLVLTVSARVLAGDVDARCLRTSPPAGTSESQVEVTAEPDHLRGRLTCRWSDASHERVSSRSLPLYRSS